MLDRARSYARTHRPGRAESSVFGVAAAALLLIGYVALARAAAQQLYVRLPAGMSAASAQRLVSALEAQLADLASIELTEPSAHDALGIVSITESAGALSIQFADARAELIGAPRLVNGAPGELSASEVASIVRAFVVARLERSAADETEARAPPAAATVGPTAREPVVQDGAAKKAGAKPAPVEPPPEQIAAATLAATPAPDPADPAARAPASAARRPIVMDRLAPSGAETWRLRLALAYTGAMYAQQLPWHDGMRLDVGARVKGPFFLGASYGYQLPAEVTDSTASVRVRVDAHGLNAFAGVGRTWRSFGVAFDAGLGAADTRRSTKYAAPGLMKNPELSHWSLLAVLRLHARLRLPGAPRMALDLAPALELSPGLRPALVETAANYKNAVLSPYLVRARLDVGAAFDVF